MQSKTKIKTPLYDALCQMREPSPARFHVPGHKGGYVFEQQAQADYKRLLALDWTELEGLDDLHHPQGVILEAQQLAAHAFGADQTYFLINGSTVGNLVMILSTVRKDDLVLVGRQCHISVIHALQMVEAQAVFLEEEILPTFQVSTGPSRSTVRQALEQYPQAKAMIFTYPTYYGMAPALGTFIEEAHRRGMIVLVDEAHGAHFGHGRGMPPSAMQLGADVSVQSTHKMLGSMTMTSMLHVQGSRIDREEIQDGLHRLQSSSPSYPLLASLDVARAYLEQKEETFWPQTLHVYDQLRQQIQHCGYVVNQVENQVNHKQEEQVLFDPFKLIIRLPLNREGEQPISGFELQRLLAKHKVYVEMADGQQVVLTLPLDPHPSWNEQLVHSLTRIQEEVQQDDPPFQADVQQTKLPQEQQGKGSPSQVGTLYSAPKQGNAVSPPISMKKVRRNEMMACSLSAAVGQRVAETITPYPPGIPVLIPGEYMDEQKLNMLLDLQKKGAYFQGKSSSNWNTIKVMVSST